MFLILCFIISIVMLFGIPYVGGAIIICITSWYKYRSFNEAMQDVLDVENYREDNIKLVMLVLAGAVGFMLALIWLVNLGKIIMYLKS